MLLGVSVSHARKPPAHRRGKLRHFIRVSLIAAAVPAHRGTRVIDRIRILDGAARWRKPDNIVILILTMRAHGIHVARTRIYLSYSLYLIGR